MDATDQGHRYGNFPNYYSFNPPQNRLQVLEESSILSYIRSGLSRLSDDVESKEKSIRGELSDGAATTSVATAFGSGDSIDGSVRKKPRMDKKYSSAQIREIYYCDLGCNEGDLTMAMATSIAKDTISCNNDDCEDEPKNKASSTTNSTASMKCLGLDLDPMLIERANAKFSSETPSASSSCTNEKPKQKDGLSSACHVKAMFKVCNLCSASEHNDAYTSFWDVIECRKTNGIAKTSNENNNGKEEPKPRFHLTTIFSTTMWIHVHSGDDGLREFLERACNWTKRFLLVEPQPSGCYRKANIRLRKMGRPELDDVTSSRLKMRPDIERDIETVITHCGFRRVSFGEVTGGTCSGNKDKQDAVTTWNRTLHLYERVVDK
ncbi:hypothetical protein ACHAXR_012871 [Thalassiosira sp. AJA248-18]